VFEGGDWLAEYGSMPALKAHIAKEPTKIHSFLADILTMLLCCTHLKNSNATSNIGLGQRRRVYVFVLCCFDVIVSSKAQKKKLLELKRENPCLRLRSKSMLGHITTVAVNLKSTQGINAPASAFVELTEYVKEFGAPLPELIVMEEINGTMLPGVNVLTGKKGWYERIDKVEGSAADLTIRAQVAAPFVVVTGDLSVSSACVRV